MNIAFLLIEQERGQYLSVIEHTKTAALRGRVVAVSSIVSTFGRFCKSLCRWAFNSLARESRAHQRWLAENRAAAEARSGQDRRLQAAQRAIARMRNACLVRCLKGWVAFTGQEKRNRGLLEKFTRRFQLRAAHSAINQWREHARERKGLRGFLNRMVGGRATNLLSAGFRKWKESTVVGMEVDDMHRRCVMLRERPPQPSSSA